MTGVIKILMHELQPEISRDQDAKTLDRWILGLSNPLKEGPWWLVKNTTLWTISHLTRDSFLVLRQYIHGTTLENNTRDIIRDR